MRHNTGRWPERHWLTHHRNNQLQTAATFDNAGDLQRALHDIGIPVDVRPSGTYRSVADAWVWGFGIPPVGAVAQPPSDPLIITTDLDLVVQPTTSGGIEIFDAVSSRTPIMRLSAAAADRLCSRIVRALGGPEAEEIATRLELVAQYIGEPLITQPMPVMWPATHTKPALVKDATPVRRVPPVGPVLPCTIPADRLVEVYSGAGSSTRLEWTWATCRWHRIEYLDRAMAVSYRAAVVNPRDSRPHRCGEIVGLAGTETDTES